MTKATARAFSDLAAYRKSRGENQSDFWSRFGVTQSGGSRYESGREIPTPTAMLVAAYSQGLLDEATLKALRKLVG